MFDLVSGRFFFGSFARIAPLLAGIALAGAARAESYDTIELGVSLNRDACMSKAENVLYQYRNNHGGGKIFRAAWVVYGWDLRPGNQDVVILCPIVNNTVDAFLVNHGEGTEANRDFTTEQVRWYWDNY